MQYMQTVNNGGVFLKTAQNRSIFFVQAENNTRQVCLPLQPSTRTSTRSHTCLHCCENGSFCFFDCIEPEADSKFAGFGTQRLCVCVCVCPDDIKSGRAGVMHFFKTAVVCLLHNIYDSVPRAYRCVVIAAVSPFPDSRNEVIEIALNREIIHRIVGSAGSA